MLKIKDNVDLKELEKFGYSKIGQPMFNDYFKNLDNNVFICISNVWRVGQNATITAYQGNVSGWLDLGGNVFEETEVLNSYIQDLIQAGLVEKVEE
ncbi:MAG: hypothetical protein J6R47_06585 [Acholeplasmatales bacterium]|nr:hypothetical protein [Acholeplasmatales bacterium]